MESKRFWNTITNLNMLFSIMIALYHNNGYSFYDDGSLSNIAKKIIDVCQNGYMANIAVPLFIFLSGFLFYRNMRWDNMREKMVSRITSLVIPYLCWNAIAGAALFFLQTVPFIRSKMEVRQMVSFDFISIVKGLTITPYNGVLWTVLQLIIFVVLAPCIFLCLKNVYSGTAALVGAFFLEQSALEIPVLIHGNEHLFTYLLGAFIGIHAYKRIMNMDFRPVQYAIAGIVIVSLCILYEFDIYNIILRIVGIIALYVVCHFVAGFTNRSSELCYGLSFWVYVIHDWMGPCIMKLWLMTGVKGNIGALISTFGMTVITIVLCILVSKLCKEMLPRTYRVLSGGRGD